MNTGYVIWSLEEKLSFTTIFHDLPIVQKLQNDLFYAFSCHQMVVMKNSFLMSVGRCIVCLILDNLTVYENSVQTLVTPLMLS